LNTIKSKVKYNDVKCIKDFNNYYNCDLFSVEIDNDRIVVFNNILNKRMSCSFSISAMQDFMAMHDINIKQEINDVFYYELTEEINMSPYIYDDIYNTYNIGKKLEQLGF